MAIAWARFSWLAFECSAVGMHSLLAVCTRAGTWCYGIHFVPWNPLSTCPA